MQENVHVGDLILVTKALPEDGVSDQYGKHDVVSVSPNFLKKLETTLQNDSQDFHKGMTWTTCAPYRETIEKLNKYKQENILTVEMEIASLCSVANYRGVEYTALLVCSDSLAGHVWKPQQNTKRVFSSLQSAYTVIEHALA